MFKATEFRHCAIDYVYLPYGQLLSESIYLTN